MAKTEKNTITAEARKTPSSKADFVEETDVDTVPSSETDPVNVAEVQTEASDTLAAIQVALSLNTSSFSDQESVALKKASVAHYRESAPADATERVFATLSVGLQNAVMTSLEHAAMTDMLAVRTEEMRNATRGQRRLRI